MYVFVYCSLCLIVHVVLLFCGLFGLFRKMGLCVVVLCCVFLSVCFGCDFALGCVVLFVSAVCDVKCLTVCVGLSGC